MNRFIPDIALGVSLPPALKLNHVFNSVPPAPAEETEFTGGTSSQSSGGTFSGGLIKVSPETIFPVGTQTITNSGGSTFGGQSNP